MAIKAADQVSIIDITDAYSVMLTSDSHTFTGSTSAALAGSTSTQVVALCGSEAVEVTVGSITTPTGVTATVSDNGTTTPTITIAVTTSVTEGGTVKIPVTITGKDVTITKEFTFGIAFKGATGQTGASGTSVTVKSTAVTYAVSDSTTQPTSWSETMPTAEAGQYLWTKTVVTYSDGNSTTTYSYALQGETGEKGDTGASGTSVTVSSTAVTYGTSASADAQPTSWSADMPAVAEGSYLWTKTVVTYSDGKSTTTYSYAKQGEKGDKGDTGETGAAGADAITISITTDNGSIFKNSEGSTTLTAHVYQSGAELTSAQISALGTLKWYKDGGTTAVGTGATLTVSASSISSKAVYTVQLEG